MAGGNVCTTLAVGERYQEEGRYTALGPRWPFPERAPKPKRFLASSAGKMGSIVVSSPWGGGDAC